MLGRTTQSLGVVPPVVYLNKFIFLLEKFYHFSLLEVLVVLGFTFFFLFSFFLIHSSTILLSKFMDAKKYNSFRLALNNSRVFGRWSFTLFYTL